MSLAVTYQNGMRQVRKKWVADWSLADRLEADQSYSRVLSQALDVVAWAQRGRVYIVRTPNGWDWDVELPDQIRDIVATVWFNDGATG